MKRLLILIIIVATSYTILGSDRKYFEDRFSINSALSFQEKLYIQTDCDSYSSNDTIRFRVHRVDATFHNPRFYSGMTYVDIYDYNDKLYKHMLIIPTDSVLSGSFKIPQGMAHGSYYLVAYTNWMQNFSSDLYYRRKIFVNNPMNKKITLSHEYHLESRDRLRVDFKLTSYTKYKWVEDRYMLDVTLIRPNAVDKVITRPIREDGSVRIRFPISDSVQYLNIEFNEDKPEDFSQRFVVPYLEDDIDLQFMPEGGQLIAGVAQRVAFKALSIDGMSTDVSGTVFDSAGNIMTFFGSSFLGMGDFMLTSKEGESYYAEITMPNGVVKRFDLPAVQGIGASLVCTSGADAKLLAAVASPGMPWDGKYLIIHCRGKLLQVSSLSRNVAFSIPNSSLPNGVIHCAIVDNLGSVFAERLIFNNLDNLPTVQVENVKHGYVKRSKVDLDLTFVDAAGAPVQGVFSASVVDDGRAMIDTTIADIKSYLLLTSDVTGNIENPSYYFDTSVPLSRRLRNADLLMLTQGWRRFDLSSVLAGPKPDHRYSLQMGQAIYGRLKNLWKDEARAGKVAMVAPSINYFGIEVTDESGEFEFSGLKFPAGTQFVIRGMNEQNKKQIDVRIWEEGYKDITNPMIETRYLLREGVVETPEAMKYDEFYRDLAVGYYYENGMLMYVMDAITIGATEAEEEEKDWIYDMYKDFAEQFILGEDLVSGAYNSIWDWLMEIPGLDVSEIDNRVRVRGNGRMEIIVDEMGCLLEDLITINLNDILCMGFTKEMGTTNLYGGAAGLLMIHLKEGATFGSPVETAWFLSIVPQGYHESVEFYTPKYETPEQINSTTFDSRFTIHWQPSIIVEADGKARLEFYTADNSANYKLRIEGVTSKGEPISYSTYIRNE